MHSVWLRLSTVVEGSAIDRRLVGFLCFLSPFLIFFYPPLVPILQTSFLAIDQEGTHGLVVAYSSSIIY